MSKVEKFFEALPLLDAIQDMGMAVLADASVRSGEVELPGRTGLDSTSEIQFRRKRKMVTASQIAQELEKALDDKRLSGLSSELFQQIASAVKTYRTASTSKDYMGVRDKLQYSVMQVENLIGELAVNAFGDWGAHFFLVALQYQNVTDRVLSRTRTRKAFPQAGDEPSGLLADIPGKPISASDVNVNEENFSVSVGARPPCFLKNTNKFGLLLSLWNHRNRYVPYTDLAEEHGGDAEDYDNLPARKCRLVDDLKESGYRDLASCIKSTEGHYGLFLKD